MIFAMGALLLLAPLGCRFDPSGLRAPDAGGAVCGDNVREAEEACDGEDLAGVSCVSLGYSGGGLQCTSSCALDESGCEAPPECGNGHLDTGEGCDGTDLGGATCLGLTGFEQGSPVCSGACLLLTTDCHTCGNGTVEGPEECDTVSGGQTCQGLGFDGGDLACGPSCRLDSSGCFACGDGVCDAALGEGWEGCPSDCSWRQIDAGRHHTCGVRRDATAWCWGANDVGQVGDGSDLDRLVPTPVLLSASVQQISAGGDVSCAVLSDTSVSCWGLNDHGQLGDGTIQSRAVPAPVTGLTDISAVSVGGSHVCALTSLGAVFCWGLNNKGQLGDGSMEERHEPVLVAQDSGLVAAVQVSAGEAHTCAVDLAGRAFCWGDHGNGRLGDDFGQDQEKPAPVSRASGLTSAAQISAGKTHTCAVDSGGQVWCWGQKADGRLGDDSNADQAIPVQVVTSGGLLGAVRVTAGEAHTCALRQDGVIFCWGNGGSGQLGDGSSTNRTVPTLLDPGAGLSVAAGVSAGGAHTVAWTPAGEGWAWGAGTLGQLGTVTVTDEPSPVIIPGT